MGWASDNGIVEGYGGNRFGSSDPITREQMATIIARYIDYAGSELPDADDPVAYFNDADDVSIWARDGLELMRRTGIIRGDGNDNFNPKNTARRSEAATIFVRLSDALGLSENDIDENLTVVADALSSSELQQYAERYVNASSESLRESYADDIFDYFLDLSADGVIDSVSWNKSTNVISFESAGGVPGMYQLSNNEGGHFGGSAEQSASARSSTTLTADGSTYLSGSEVVILSSFPKSTSDYNSTYLNLIGVLGNSETREDLNVTYYEDAEVADYMNLSGATVILFNSHGSLYKDLPVICLDESVTDIKNTSYIRLLMEGAIGINGSTLLNTAKYMILPSFFTEVYGSDGLEGALVHSCCCEGFANDAMADAILSAGAETYSGYTATVNISYDRTCVNSYFEALLDGKSVSVAYTDVTEAVDGKADTYAGATFKIAGNRSVYLVNSSLLSGTVFNENSTGISGASVTLMAGNQVLASTTTSGDGSYSLPCSWDSSSYRLVVSADGFANKEISLYTQISRQYITMTRAVGQMSITLRSSSGQPLGSYSVRVLNGSGIAVWETSGGLSSFITNNSSITLSTNEITANTDYTIIASATNYTSVTQLTRLSQGENLAVDIELYKGGYGCQGRVVDASSGSAISGADVELVTSSGTVYGSSNTSQDGSFTVMAPAGLARYSLRVSADGYETYESGSILFALNTPTDVGTIRLSTSGGQGNNGNSSQPEGNYTMIYSAADLAGISGMAGNYMLANDIDATGYSSSVISTLSKNAVLEGNGHTIAIDQRHQYFGGLIGINYGVICNLNVTGTAVFEDQQTNYFGGIVGINSGLIESCTFTGTINSSSGITYGQDYSSIGGIAGINSDGGQISDCTMSGSINLSMTSRAIGWYVGGIAGSALPGSSMENCVNHASVNVNIQDPDGSQGSTEYRAYVAGICGRAQEWESTFILNCLNTASVTANTNNGVTFAAGVCTYSGTLTGSANTGSRIYAGAGSNLPDYSGSTAYAVGPNGGSDCFCSSSTTLYDTRSGSRNVSVTDSILTLHSASEITSMW